MNRRTATISTPLRLWEDIEAAMRGVARVFNAAMADDGLAMLNSERSRIAKTGRHWLMG